MSDLLPPHFEPDAVKLRIQQSIRNPNVGKVSQLILREGPRAFRFATLYEILRKDGSHHHFCLRIDSYTRTKRGWEAKPEKSVSLESDGDNELARLSTLLQSAATGTLPSASGEYRILPEQQFDRLRDLLGLVRASDAQRRIRILQAILSSFDASSVSGDDWRKLFEVGAPAVLQTVSAAARMVEYKRAFTELSAAIEDAESNEATFQGLLIANPWMFGSEYSELVPRRTWTRDDRLDFMLRRTVDDFLEIVEIKTPLRQPLFRYDQSHDCYYPSAALSNVIGQVARYIEEVERQRDTILAKDGVDTLKIRARVIIGRDGDAGQRHGLRNLNGHLHRIEIVTYDQLLRTAGRVIEVFESKIGVSSRCEEAPDEIDNFPF